MTRIAYSRLFTSDKESSGDGLDFTHIIDVDLTYADTAENTVLAQRDAMLAQGQKNDEVIAQSFSSCSLDREDLTQFAQNLINKGMNLICIDENFDLSTFSGRMKLENTFPVYDQSDQESLNLFEDGYIIGDELADEYREKKRLQEKEEEAKLEVIMDHCAPIVPAKEEPKKRGRKPKVRAEEYIMPAPVQEAPLPALEEKEAYTISVTLPGVEDLAHRRGRHPKKVDGRAFDEAYAKLKRRQISKKDMQTILGLSYPTLMKLINEREAAEAE